MTAYQVSVTAGDAAGQTSFTVASPVAQFVGAVCSPPGQCPSSVSAWLSSPFKGNQANKQFYSGTQAMTTWQAGHLSSDNESQLPSGALSIITFKDAQIKSLPKYVASIPANTNVWMCYWQEAEDSYTSHDYKTFIANFVAASNMIRSVGHPGVKILQDSAGYQYGVKGSTAQQGLWVVPPEHVDIYSIDCYQNQPAGQWPSQGLANYTEFQTWLSIYAPLGKPLAITEYGVASCNGDAARNTRIQADAAYLRSAFSGPNAVSKFPLAAWLYWYSDCQAGQLMTDCQHQHQFTDAATIATWQSIINGTL